jgi:hypothetical protein
MTDHKQTWWDKEIKNQFNDFKSWVGSTEETSKKWARAFITNHNYKSVVDIGCGMCDEHFEYKKLDPELIWTGVDSSFFLTNEAVMKGGKVINREGHDTGLADNRFEVSYSRHVWEHQKHYLPIMLEMIRISSKLMMHVFFIKPQEEEIIHYTESNNLYHNTFDKNEIEAHLKLNDKVKDWIWVPMSDTPEVILIVDLK